MLNVTKMVHFNEAYVVSNNASVAKNTATQFQMRDKHWKYAIIGTTATDGNITFNAGDSALAGGDLVIPVKAGTFAITVEDALVKTQAPTIIDGESLLDVVTFKSDVDLTNVMIVKLP